jgi:hypothetical protein
MILWDVPGSARSIYFKDLTIVLITTHERNVDPLQDRRRPISDFPASKILAPAQTKLKALLTKPIRRRIVPTTKDPTPLRLNGILQTHGKLYPHMQRVLKRIHQSEGQKLDYRTRRYHLSFLRYQKYG